MSFFGNLYNSIVTQPTLNTLQLLENLTGDTGIAIILIAILINFALWPIFIKNYISQQKQRYLAPELEKIQNDYKSNPQEMLMRRAELMRKHKVSNKGILLLLLQIPFLIALYDIIIKITQNQTLTGIYSFINPDGVARFSDKAFGILNAAGSVTQSGAWGLVFPLIVSLLTLLNGLYLFRWAKKPKLPEPKKTKQSEKQSEFMNALQKNMEIQQIYVMPILYFFIAVSLPLGLSLYFIGSSLAGLVRQVAVSEYYTRNAEKLLESVIKSDPVYGNTIEVKAEKTSASGDDLAALPVATKILDVTPQLKKSSSKKKRRKR